MISANHHRKALLTTLLLSCLLWFSVPSAAFAATYSNSYSGRELAWEYSTTLNYTNGHAAFKLAVNNEKCAGIFDFLVNNTFTIKMYNSTGKLVWSASGQRSPSTYSIGSNVTRVVIDRPWAATLLYWSKK